jgi:hypothetical protein
MTFNADGNLLAIVYRDDESFVVTIHDVSDGVESFQSEPNYDDPPHFIQFPTGEPLNRLRYVAPGEQVRIWNYATKTVEEHVYDANVHSIRGLPSEIGFQCIVSSKTKRELFWWPEHKGTFKSDCMDVHGGRLAIGSNCGILTLLDMSRLQDVQQ